MKTWRNPHRKKRGKAAPLVFPLADRLSFIESFRQTADLKEKRGGTVSSSGRANPPRTQPPRPLCTTPRQRCQWLTSLARLESRPRRTRRRPMAPSGLGSPFCHVEGVSLPDRCPEREFLNVYLKTARRQLRSGRRSATRPCRASHSTKSERFFSPRHSPQPPRSRQNRTSQRTSRPDRANAMRSRC